MRAVDRALGPFDAAPHAGCPLRAGLERSCRAAWRWHWAPATSASRARCAPGPRGGPSAPAARGGSGGPLPGGKAGRPPAPRRRSPPRPARRYGSQILVGQRPVVGDAVERADAKVRRHVPLPMGRVEHAAAADRVVQDRGDVRIRIVDRIVGRRLPRDWDWPTSRGRR